MEYVKVTFKEDRAVIMDDQNNGRSNMVLRVGAGIHTFTLGGDKNFSPDSITCEVSGTNEFEPKVLEFEVSDDE
ncbi:MAG: hypothetical protein HKN34_00900 [Gammaproteobacteria bacterium]|nr:hypothetical protein [Gammaproteobacteria bacterium]